MTENSELWIAGWYQIPTEDATEFIYHSFSCKSWKKAQKWLTEQVAHGRSTQKWHEDDGFNTFYAQISAYIHESTQRNGIRPVSFRGCDGIRCYYIMWDGTPKKLYECDEASLPPITDPRLSIGDKTDTRLLSRIIN